MLILILIDVQYSRKALFSFEKGLNCQNYSSSCSLHLVKKFPPVKFPIPLPPPIFTKNSDAEVYFPSEPVSQYICMKLPKTDDNDRTHKNDANILSWHMFNASFHKSAPWIGHSMSSEQNLMKICEVVTISKYNNRENFSLISCTD